MITRLTSLLEIAERFDAIVLDQWGVLHDGTSPYPSAQKALADLAKAGPHLAVLSNSGKRATPNRDRIGAMGFDTSVFKVVMTSGEALWADCAAGTVKARRLYPIERAPGDAAKWAEGLDVDLTSSAKSAEAILLMGLPDDAAPDSARDALDVAKALDLPVLCTNPDRASPRAGGVQVMSPGALAHAHQAAGGRVTFYGKPHVPVFRAVETVLDVAPDRVLMVGDSLEHDIAGGQAAGWSTAFIEGGLHADHFLQVAAPRETLAALAAAQGVPPPTYSLEILR